MSRPTRTRSAATILLSALVAALVTSPVPVAGHGLLPQAPAPRERSADLAPALGADGTFHGATGLAGSIDPSAWTLVSNLATGEPPRFAPAAAAPSPSATGPWSALGSNGRGDGALDSPVSDLAVSGTDIYAVGWFTNAALKPADRVAKWNGTAWSAIGPNGQGVGAFNGAVLAIAVFGSDLYVGGEFSDAAGIPAADSIAKWNGSTWSALGSNGHGDGALGESFVEALAVSGSDLYVGGDFTDAAGIPEADYIARWNGSAWSALGSNGRGGGALMDDVYALAVSDSDLYVGGNFSNAAGIRAADAVARWNGTAWSALGSDGHGNGAIRGGVVAFAVSGNNLYVGGFFSNAAGIAAADNVARWNGRAWSALGSNGHGNGAIFGGVVGVDSYVNALAVSGDNLYVGGVFRNAAGIAAADNVARWNGRAWSALGSNGAGNGAIKQRFDGSDVNALAVSGNDLYVGGLFTNAAGIPAADYIARWSGSSNPVVMPPTDTLSGAGRDAPLSGALVLVAGLLGFVLARRRLLAARAAP